MLSYRLYFCGALMLTLSSFAHAGAPQLSVSKCLDKNRREVPTEYSTSMNVFAEARGSKSTSDSTSVTQLPYFIFINPDRYYLGRYTQQWLYQRQCVHIQKDHAVIYGGSRRLDIKEELQADCLAFKAMLDNTDKPVSKRDIYSIERDISRVVREKRWKEVLPGPERRVSYASCIAK